MCPIYLHRAGGLLVFRYTYCIRVATTLAAAKAPEWFRHDHIDL